MVIAVECIIFPLCMWIYCVLCPNFLYISLDFVLSVASSCFVFLLISLCKTSNINQLHRTVLTWHHWLRIHGTKDQELNSWVMVTLRTFFKSRSLCLTWDCWCWKGTKDGPSEIKLTRSFLVDYHPRNPSIPTTFRNSMIDNIISF
jgi:hypothetical protein